MRTDIKIIPIEDHLDSQRDGMVRLSVTIPRDKMQKLHDFMDGDTWEKAQAARNAKLSECLKSVEIALDVRAAASLAVVIEGQLVFAVMLHDS